MHLRPLLPSILFTLLLTACPDDPVGADDGEGGGSPTTGTTSTTDDSATHGGATTAGGTGSATGSATGPTADGPDSGSTSPPGTTDSTGPSGSTDSSGSTGPSGSTGSSGSTGPSGSTGSSSSTDEGTTFESTGQAASTGSNDGTGSESSSGDPGCGVPPDAIPGLVLWLRADVVIEDPLGVLTWTDQSPLGNDATRGPGSPAAPQRLLGGFSGQDAVRFAGDAVLTLDNDLALGDFTIFVVGVSTKVDEAFHMILGPGPLNQQVRYNNSNDILLVGPGNGGPVSVYSPGNNKVPHYFTIDGLGGDWSLYWNSAFVSTEVAAVGLWQLGSVGAWFGQHFLVADLAEIIVYDASLAADVRDGVHCYLSDRYGLP